MAWLIYFDVWWSVLPAAITLGMVFDEIPTAARAQWKPCPRRLQFTCSLGASAGTCQAAGTVGAPYFRRLRALGGVLPLSKLLLTVMFQVDGSIFITVDNQATLAAAAFIRLLAPAAAFLRSFGSCICCRSASWQTSGAP